ncbi:uncharacterized protein LOC132316325 [Cornus florida]|uniref:uncharacterized protein LOC132316325 n=1 Tax=Cornus florida TaxID=4283 RepID=UPI00289C6996|nr:uncharacterized protein LOC132316325 [Cornus florida]
MSDDYQSKKDIPSASNIDNDLNSQPSALPQVVEPKQLHSTYIERDPGLCIQIHEYPVNQRDEVRRTYINLGPYQPKLSNYPNSRDGRQNRRFKYEWFQQFPWLEFSPSKDKAYCFSCFLFEERNITGCRSSLIDDIYKNWKKVGDGDNCVFLKHMGLQSSAHRKCAMLYENLNNSAQHIDKVLNAQSREDVLKNRMRLKATIETVRFLALQGIGFRGHVESSSSLNRGNFIEALKYKAKGNDEISSVILDNVPQNAQYIAPSIQKEILHILANRVRKMICDEVAGGVENTSAVTLKDAISGILARFDLSIQNLRAQGYDGATLVAAAKDEPKVWLFFSHLTCIVNLVTSSPKRVGELKSFQRDEIASLLSTGECQSCKGANQIGTLHRAGATRWSSHYDSVRNLIDMYAASCTVVESLRKDGQNQQIRG